MLPQEPSAVRPLPLSTRLRADYRHQAWHCDARSSRTAISTDDSQSQHTHTVT